MAASEMFWHTEPGFVGRQWRDLMPLMESGAIDPPIGSVFALDGAGSAIRAMDERRAGVGLLIRIAERGRAHRRLTDYIPGADPGPDADSSLVDDFRMHSSGPVTAVRNAP